MNKQEMQNKIDELKSKVAELEEELNNLENKVFKPKCGDTYYFICNYGSAKCATWRNDEIDNNRYDVGNLFQTKERAEFEIERLKVIVELKRFAQEHNEPIDWSDRSQYKHYIAFNAEINQLDYYCAYTIKQTHIYFSSKEIARQAVEEVGEERIKKYYLGVDDE